MDEATVRAGRVSVLPGLRLVHVSDDRVVLKRGLTEMLISGSGATSVVGRLLPLLAGSRDVDEVLAAIPPELTQLAAQLLSTLQARHLLRLSGDAPSPEAPEPPLAGF